MFRPFWRGGELTKVTTGTELGIPILTYASMAIGGCLFIVGCFSTYWLSVLSEWLENGTFKEWWRVFFIPWIGRYWPTIIIACIVWCITIPLFMLMVRLSMEQLLKQWKIIDIENLFRKKK